mgnify:CR=1 FL=1
MGVMVVVMVVVVVMGVMAAAVIRFIAVRGGKVAQRLSNGGNLGSGSRIVASATTTSTTATTTLQITNQPLREAAL